jgi:hypothetical protein
LLSYEKILMQKSNLNHSLDGPDGPDGSEGRDGEDPVQVKL